ncbi:hypothetical protein Ddye_015163 [Dipteronia dyeriana]|uniref:Rab-GAP TBC domain-containing protein n=1 Tax=Dipteronia dyeriana TaxID=168575 RepID=A0AAD9U5E6_9ROSI|nr:hypothetical protein Ddye_015163 [Dipteronia dyeriana]
MPEMRSNLLHTFQHQHTRDAYGFALRPQHIQTYRKYIGIFKEEEAERSEKWNNFIQHLEEQTEPGSPEENYKDVLQTKATELKEEIFEKSSEGDKAEATELEESTVSGSDSEENEAKATELKETIVQEGSRKHNESEATAETVSEKGREGDKAEDAKLKEEIVSEGNKKDNKSEATGETVSEDNEGNEVETTKLKEEIVSESSGESNKSESREEIVSGRGKEADEDEDIKLEEDIVSGRSGKGNESEATEETVSESREGDDPSRNPDSDGSTDCDPKKEQISKETKTSKVQTWAHVRPSLGAIENMMSFRVKKRNDMKGEQLTNSRDHLPSIGEEGSSEWESEKVSKKRVSVNKTSKESGNASRERGAQGGGVPPEPYFSWKEELECLVRGGVPKDLRGEVWQAFVGVKARRVERYYQDLLAQETNAGEIKDHNNSSGVPRKYKRQIEKDLPRTFPGHPALNEDGRDSLRRLLLAYARHNPSVGYCQAMNFFAGLLLLLMPEENAFWTLVGIIDDYFAGCYTEEMIESQVDQLVFEELIRERFPKLVNHLDYLGVQVAWISGPWFLSIFVNMLPWDSVLRVWDVLLYEGNRVMLFRTALALMEIYGPVLITTKDAGDAITLFQSLTGSTFDSSQLVFTACMGYLGVTEARLQELREKHKPAVQVVIEESSKGGRVWKDSKGLASKLYSFKHERGSQMDENKTTVDGDISHAEPPSSDLDELLSGLNSEVDSVADLQEQVVWMKVELCRLLEQKRSAILRAEELETALMEMVTQDNRRLLNARIEQLEEEVADLRQALADKKEQESAMLQVLMRVEQEQRVTEDARRRAEQDVATQKYAVHVLEEKYEKAMASLAQMEKRVVMAESTLEATLQYQSGKAKAISSPKSLQNQGSTVDSPRRRTGLFGLGWRDRNKGKQTNVEESSNSKSTTERTDSSTSQKETEAKEQEP